MRLPKEKEIQIKAAAEYILANDIPPKLAQKILQQYYKSRIALIKLAVNSYAPELKLQYLKWAERHKVISYTHKQVVDKQVKIEEDKYLQALQKSGIYFEDRTMKDLCTRY